jgi:hypothetical protein
MLLVLLAVVMFRGHKSNGSKASAPPSSSEQWFQAVCKSGTFRGGGGNGQWLSNSVSRSSCGSSQVPSVWIFIGQYSSDYLARNDAALYHFGSSAMTRDTDGYMLFAAPTDRSAASLQPLVQFGFTITTGD